MRFRRPVCVFAALKVIPTLYLICPPTLLSSAFVSSHTHTLSLSSLTLSLSLSLSRSLCIYLCQYVHVFREIYVELVPFLSRTVFCTFHNRHVYAASRLSRAQHTPVGTHTCLCKHMHPYIRTYINMYMYMYVCIHVYVSIPVYLNTCIYIKIYVCAYIYAYTRAYTLYAHDFSRIHDTFCVMYAVCVTHTHTNRSESTLQLCRYLPPHIVPSFDSSLTH